MLVATLLTFSLTTTSFAQMPTGYRTVYISSLVDTTFRLVPKVPVNGSTIVVQKRADTVQQQWYIKDGNTTIQLANSTLCLDAGAKSNWKDMASIYTITCADGAAGQQWVAMADGRIALAASSPQECVDLQYARATPNNPVGLYSCAGLGNTGAADKGINWPLTNVTV